jgi:hypothetical protein
LFIVTGGGGGGSGGGDGVAGVVTEIATPSASFSN